MVGAEGCRRGQTEIGTCRHQIHQHRPGPESRDDLTGAPTLQLPCRLLILLVFNLPTATLIKDDKFQVPEPDCGSSLELPPSLENLEKEPRMQRRPN